MSKSEVLSSVEKPFLDEVDVDNIPVNIRGENRWLSWDFVLRDGKWVKVPTNFRDGKWASASDPTIYGTLTEVVEAGRGDGIGFALGDGWAGFDLDDCRNPLTSELTEQAQGILNRVNSYAEISPTLTGIKIFVRADLPEWLTGTKSKDGTVEFYSSGRFFTVTGLRVESTPEWVEYRTAEAIAVHREFIGVQQPPTKATENLTHSASVDELLDGIRDIGPRENENDGSNRLMHVQYKIVELNGSLEDAIVATRLYETIHPFPSKFSDSEIIRRYRDAEKKAVRGSAIEPDWSEWAESAKDWYVPYSQFRNENSEVRETVVDGVLQRGDVANIIAASKIGKSYLSCQLALSVAAGVPWFGHETLQGDVLIVDNELHADTLNNRIRKVREAMNLPRDVENRIFVASLRGNLVALDELCKRLTNEPQGRFILVILDALYRMQPKGTDENSNGGITEIYNLIDQTAARLGCALVLVHHASKGDQSRKAVTDVGSGAGAQSRAVDCHLVLRPHSDEGCLVMQAAIRAFPSLKPVVLKREFPIWVVCEDANPDSLRPIKPAMSGEDFAAWVKPGEYGKAYLTEKLQTEKQLSERKAKQVIAEAIEAGTLQVLPRTNNNQKQMVRALENKAA